MNNNDNGFNELLDILKAHPKLISKIVFHRDEVLEVLETLGSRAARDLARGVDPKTFLTYLASPRDGYAVAFCGGGTEFLCAKGTELKLPICGGGTGPPRQTQRARRSRAR